MNELVCVSVFNPVTFSEAYPDIDHYKVCLFSNQCSILFQTSDVGRQLAPDVLSPNFFLHRALDFVTSLLALEWIQSPGQKALLCALLPHYQIKIISDFKKFLTTHTMLSECRGNIFAIIKPRIVDIVKAASKLSGQIRFAVWWSSSHQIDGVSVVFEAQY